MKLASLPGLLIIWLLMVFNMACNKGSDNQTAMDSTSVTADNKAASGPEDKWSGITADVYENGGCMTLWMYSNGHYTQQLFEQDISVLPYHEQMNINSYDLITCKVKGAPRTISHESRGTYVKSGSTYYFYPRASTEYMVAGEDDKGRKYLAANGWGDLEFYRTGDYQKVIYNRVSQNCYECVSAELEREKEKIFNNKKENDENISREAEHKAPVDCVLVVYNSPNSNESLSQQFPEDEAEIIFPDIQDQDVLGSWDLKIYSPETKLLIQELSVNLLADGNIRGANIKNGVWRISGKDITVSINDVSKMTVKFAQERLYGTGKGLAGNFLVRGVKVD